MKTGLSDKEVEINRSKYGRNTLPNVKKRTIFNLIIESFNDPIIKILLIALAIKIAFMFKNFNWYETLGILIAIFLATLISTLSEYGSESAFQKLQEENKDLFCKVYRNNILTDIKSSDIVYGDNVLVESGDIIPADGIITDGFLSIDESMLTGESKLQKKSNIDRKNVYKGTVIFEGRAIISINAVGTNTIYGKIAKEVMEQKTKSPLKVRLLKLSKIINRIGYIGAFLVALSYLFSVIVIKNHFDINIIRNYIFSKNIVNDLIYTLTLCVTTIVVAVPEGLPMMITLVLSSNMKRLIKDNVLVRKMVGIETSGNINYLLTDKTGTITEGKLNVQEIVSGDLVSYSNLNNMNKDYKDIFIRSIVHNISSTIGEKNIVGGNSTDKAIASFFKDEKYNNKLNINYIPFNSEKKYSEVYINNEHFIKGAYDVLINKCNYIYDHNKNKKVISRKLLDSFVDRLSKKSLRVIANIEEVENTYILIGLIVIKDKIRKESFEGIKNIKNAGINIIMITGDSIDAARNIARETNIISSDKDIVISSNEFNKYSDEKISSIINNVKVIARALPTDKSKLVKILQDKGNVVGMTGDGVNDAPALKKADVGFAMGSGTSIAKEASDIVILDNNLLSISKAILFGRTIFKSIRKFIVYQLSVNLCALSLSIIGPFIGINTPITIVQMLWLNMIMDTFAGLAFSFEPYLSKYINEKPLLKTEPVVNKKMYIEIITNGLYSGLVCILFLKLPIIKNIISFNKKYFMTAYFALFIFLGIFNAFSCRTENVNIFDNINKNKSFLFIFIFISIMQIIIIYYGGSIFGTYGLRIKDLLLIIGISSSTLLINTMRKKIMLKKD